MGRVQGGEARLVRIDLTRGKTLARVGLPGAPIAVALGFGSHWALDSSRLYRLDVGSGRVTRRISLGAAGALWIPVRTAEVDGTGSRR